MGPSYLHSVPKTAAQSLYAAESPLGSSADDMDDCDCDFGPENLMEYEPTPYSPACTFDSQAVQYAGRHDHKPLDLAVSSAKQCQSRITMSNRSSVGATCRVLEASRQAHVVGCR